MDCKYGEKLQIQIQSFNSSISLEVFAVLKSFVHIGITLLMIVVEF